MKGWFATLGVVAQMAFRNLFASRLKTIIVGGIIFFGGLLVVVGNSLLDSLVASMSRSVIGSVAGHIQVYNAQSKDKLEVMGRMMMGDPDLSQLDDFAKVRASLLKVPNIKSVVPMGISGALVTSGNTIDLALEKLRNAVKARVAAKTDADRAKAEAQVAGEKGHVRQIVSVLQGDLKNAKAVMDEKTIDPADVEAVNRAASDAFWSDFDKNPFDGLEFLENRIASQAADADLLFLNYVGTDFQAFQKSFDRMKIVEGTIVPPGKRGFLFAKHVYEEQLKLKAARRLDQIKEGIEAQGETIATDPDLKRMVRENSSQVREILLQLDAAKTADFRAKLQRELGSQETDVGKLLAAFFQTDDQNFRGRYDFFYKELAPSLELYRVRIGDVLTIKAFTRSGYVQSVNVPVYGTFEFQGLEKSTLAGALNLMDMVSFRELYGFMSGEKLAEIQALQKEAGAHDVSRENAEAELFGSKSDSPAGDETKPPIARTEPGSAGRSPSRAGAGTLSRSPRRIEATTTPGVAPIMRDLGESLGGKLQREEARSRVFPPDEVERGVVLNAAVILKDPKKIKETIAAIEAQGKADGLTLKAIDWQAAAGLIGQFVNVIRIVLYVAILIIFLIALVIINNALVMATLERVKEIGTLRAIGAQRRFILAMLVVESIVVGLIFGGLGAGLGVVIVSIVGKIGIPARSDVWFFFFSGPRLYPFIGTSNIIAAFAIVLVVSAFSSFYPAWIAMRVTPRQAMQEEE
ncbi:MAG TPA: FtsX-like permease family protein [Polyangia bacterium]|nr:FtsX-like permease family protein [Polyangia bacterium]